MSELLPCPFCGGTEQFVLTPTCKESDPYNPADTAVPLIRCRGCYTDVPGKNWDHSGKSAITRWNTRATTPTASELVEALRWYANEFNWDEIAMAVPNSSAFEVKPAAIKYDRGSRARAALSNIGEE